LVVVGKHYKIIVPAHYDANDRLVREHVVRFQLIALHGDTAVVKYKNGKTDTLPVKGFKADPEHHIFDKRGNKYATQKKAAKKLQEKKRQLKQKTKLPLYDDHDNGFYERYGK
jgi:hypothetical protein